MPYDAMTMADWQISEAAEEKMKSIWRLQGEIGLQKDEIIPSGRVGRIDFAKTFERLHDKTDGQGHGSRPGNHVQRRREPASRGYQGLFRAGAHLLFGCPAPESACRE